jgi:hypothetical protein
MNGTPTDPANPCPSGTSCVPYESPFIYILGGSTNTTATNAMPSTERTIW